MFSLVQNERCIICHQALMPKVGWVQLFSKETCQNMCDECQNKLKEICGPSCEICGRSFDNGEYAFKKGKLCYDCIRWEDDPEWSGKLVKNHPLFIYNEFLKEVLATYKYRGDYLISNAFASIIKAKLKSVKFDKLVPIPLSDERLYERGFNQADALITAAGFTSTTLLVRAHSEKQSKKSRNERIHLPQVFMIKTQIDITGQHILLVDDIYTTGSTLRHAAKALLKAGAASVASITIARG